VRQELYEADRRAGLGVGGPFVRALEEGTQGEGPARGSATFVITTDGSGRVTDVSVVSASADRPAWAHVAKRIASAFSAPGRRVRDRGRGVVIRIEVDVKSTLPSGAAPGSPVHGHVPPSPTSGAPDAVGTSAAGPGLGFDVADIGARARRVVHARVLEEAAR
jgi:hypothetical protein